MSITEPGIKEVMSSEPEWIYLLGLYLRIVELEHLEEASEDFL